MSTEPTQPPPRSAAEATPAPPVPPAPSSLDAADYDPLDEPVASGRPRRRYELHDAGFKEVPKRYRRFYRSWGGADDPLAPNEALCPVCKVVIRSRHELRAGDRVFCMACMMRFDLVATQGGGLEMMAVY